jgi:hypothetical protein
MHEIGRSEDPHRMNTSAQGNIGCGDEVDEVVGDFRALFVNRCGMMIKELNSGATDEKYSDRLLWLWSCCGVGDEPHFLPYGKSAVLWIRDTGFICRNAAWKRVNKQQQELRMQLPHPQPHEPTSNIQYFEPNIQSAIANPLSKVLSSSGSVTAAAWGSRGTW